jgi:hypothetical protein
MKGNVKRRKNDCGNNSPNKDKQTHPANTSVSAGATAVPAVPPFVDEQDFPLPPTVLLDEPLRATLSPPLPLLLQLSPHPLPPLQLHFGKHPVERWAERVIELASSGSAVAK